MAAPTVIDLTADDVPEVVNLVSDDEPVQDVVAAPTEPKKRRRRNRKRNEHAEPEDERDQPRVNGAALPAATPKTTGKAKERGRRDREHDDSTRKRRDKSASPRRSRSPSRRKRIRSDSPDRRARRHSRALSRERPRSPTPFLIDTTATILPNMDDLESPSKLNGADHELILPPHVSLYKGGEEPSMVQDRSETPLSEVSFIEVVDLDPDARKTTRYYEEEEKPASIICTTCGQQGHNAKRCTMIVCLMCGVKDEHITPMCPVSRVCFNCNQKGHLSKDCPRPRHYGRQTQHDCERCGSSNHLFNNCPFLWRLYVYVNDAERDVVLASRLAKRNLALGGAGGEGYIAMDEWCYNCAGRGHLGDDCPEGGRHSDRARDPSAFSAYNQASGPFASQPDHEHAGTLRHRSRSPSAAHRNARALPEDRRRPGKDAKEKQKRKGQELLRRAEEAEEDDWFNRQQSRKKAGEKSEKKKDKEKDKEKSKSYGGRDKDRKRSGDKERRSRDPDYDRDRDRDRRSNSRSHHSHSTKNRGGSGWNEEPSRSNYSNSRSNGPRFAGGYS